MDISSNTTKNKKGESLTNYFKKTFSYFNNSHDSLFIAGSDNRNIELTNINLGANNLESKMHKILLSNMYIFLFKIQFLLIFNKFLKNKHLELYINFIQ